MSIAEDRSKIRAKDLKQRSLKKILRERSKMAAKRHGLWLNIACNFDGFTGETSGRGDVGTVVGYVSTWYHDVEESACRKNILSGSPKGAGAVFSGVAWKSTITFTTSQRARHRRSSDRTASSGNSTNFQSTNRPHACLIRVYFPPSHDKNSSNKIFYCVSTCDRCFNCLSSLEIKPRVENNQIIIFAIIFFHSGVIRRIKLLTESSFNRYKGQNKK